MTFIISIPLLLLFVLAALLGRLMKKRADALYSEIAIEKDSTTLATSTGHWITCPPDCDCNKVYGFCMGKQYIHGQPLVYAEECYEIVPGVFINEPVTVFSFNDNSVIDNKLSNQFPGIS